MTKLQTIIIEDEEPARTLVKKFLEAQPLINLIGEYADGFSGLKAINELKPDLVLLDIQMPKLTGFELLELAEHKPLIIFTTAYDAFAIKAFEMNATDYLLKPFAPQRFAEALQKAIAKFANKTNNDATIAAVLKTIDEKPEIIDRIAVRNGAKIHVVATHDIVYLEAEGDYVMIHTKDGKYLKEKTMRYFETHLEPKTFIRIHRSFIANVSYIARLEHYDKEQYVAIMKTAQQLKVSSSGYRLLKEALQL